MKATAVRDFVMYGLGAWIMWFLTNSNRSVVDRVAAGKRFVEYAKQYLPEPHWVRLNGTCQYGELIVSLGKLDEAANFLDAANVLRLAQAVGHTNRWVVGPLQGLIALNDKRGQPEATERVLEAFSAAIRPRLESLVATSTDAAALDEAAREVVRAPRFRDECYRAAVAVATSNQQRRDLRRRRRQIDDRVVRPLHRRVARPDVHDPVGPGNPGSVSRPAAWRRDAERPPVRRRSRRFDRRPRKLGA